MGKKNFNKGIDNVFSSTVNVEESKDVKEFKDKIEVKNSKANDESQGYANYNIRYTKELQKRIKRFCIENEGVDMKDVFTRGAVMYMESY